MNDSESSSKNDQLLEKDLIYTVLDRMKSLPKIGHEEIDFLMCCLNFHKTKLLSKSRMISKTNETNDQSSISNTQSTNSQPIQSINQNIQALMQQHAIPSLISQSFILPNSQIQPPINFMPTLPNSANQIPALMSLQNRASVPNQPRVPALMTLRPNFRPSGQNSYFQNNKRY